MALLLLENTSFAELIYFTDLILKEIEVSELKYKNLQNYNLLIIESDITSCKVAYDLINNKLNESVKLRYINILTKPYKEVLSLIDENNNIMVKYKKSVKGKTDVDQVSLFDDETIWAINKKIEKKDNNPSDDSNITNKSFTSVDLNNKRNDDRRNDATKVNKYKNDSEGVKNPDEDVIQNTAEDGNKAIWDSYEVTKDTPILIENNEQELKDFIEDSKTDSNIHRKDEKREQEIESKLSEQDNNNLSMPRIEDLNLEELSNYNVQNLRKLARSFDDFPIKGRQISMANKNILLDYFKDIIK